MTGWLTENWLHIAVPVLAFAAILAVGFWARWFIRRLLRKQETKSPWIQNTGLIEVAWNQLLIWSILLGGLVAVEISVIPQTAKKLTSEGLVSLFIVALMWTAIRLSSRMIRFYIGKTEATQSLTSIAQNVARITIIVIGLLVLFDVWGVPTFPITLVLVAGLFIVVFTFRNTLDNLLAGLEIAYSEHIKVGHFIRLGSGETGHITKISWTRTVIRNNEGNLVIIPNYKLMANIIINHGSVDPGGLGEDVEQTASVGAKTHRLIDTLSDREREVLALIGTGATNREIAEKLIISEHTVKSHLRSILNKLDIRNRQQAAAYAEREGLVAAPDPQENKPLLP